MLLARFPRRRYTQTKTPIEKLERLSELLGGPTIYMKRDDMLGLAAGGNKTRKLEFLMADAIEKGADTIITCGSLQSNHCRLTLAAAVKEGLSCHLVLEETSFGKFDPDASGNQFLYKLLGAHLHVVKHGSNMLEEMTKVSEALKAEGHHPYIVPLGGSNELGTLGYISCAQEILEQSFEEGITFDHMISANGSGGTCAGLSLGFFGRQAPIQMHLMGVSGDINLQTERVNHLIEKTQDLLGISCQIPKDKLHFYDDYVGEGYAIPTEAMVEAVQMLARVEGILLDPVYTGKAMSGLIDLIRKGKFKKEENVLFIHTGGSPALYANMALFEENVFSIT